MIFLVLLSAIFFVSAFYGFLCGLFIFLIPLYSIFLEKKLSFSYGFVWGVTFFFIHSFDFFRVVYQQGYGTFRLLYPTLFVLYCSLFPGVWFLTVTYLQKRYQNYQKIFWIVGTFLYFLWIDKGLLSPFGRVEGLPLCFVLLPLFYKPVYAQLLGILGKWVSVVMLIMISVVIVEGYLKKMAQLSSLLLLFFFTGEKSEPLPGWFDNVVSITLDRKTTVQERLEIITQGLSEKKNKLVILPESSISFFNNKGYESVYLLQQHMPEASAYIFGTHILKEKKLFNTFIFCDRSRIIHSYEKSHLVPFFEYNPFNIFQYEFLFNFFLHKKMSFTISEKSSIPIKHNQIGPFLPVICSELFWDKQRRKYPQIPLICIANDSYFTGFGYARFMLLAAQLIAITEKRAIIYCSWLQAYFINSQAYLKKI